MSYDILFEPVRIGPVTTKNRFYQVPHCNGMGYRYPNALAAMRGMKAEGGWGVVCTEEVEIHHSTDLAPYVECRLWSDDDIPALQRLCEAIHAHGALAGVELTYAGHQASNLISRTPTLGLRSVGHGGYLPGQTRRMDKGDIRALRRWHRDAALRARRAGFDLVYCYAGHGLALAMHFLLRRYNDRTDEYGGSLENRARLLRELIEDTKDAVGDRCGVVVRLAVDELLGEDGITHQGEGHDIVALLAELPDLWDVNVSDWPNDSATSRFEKQGFQEPYVAFVKKLTSKPVVAVGRYTSPDAMVSAIRRGVVDLIGAARPSIADPFLPNKIKEGRADDIRECIGCNICVTGDLMTIPIRCTQNPTMGEEWRRGWHPERVPKAASDKEVLVVGAGPAGLECARALGQRGYRVLLAEARRELGGRVLLESRLPGLSEWRRVLDYREVQLRKLGNVSVYRESRMTVEDVLEGGYQHVIVATGATWRRDGVGRTLWRPVPGCDGGGDRPAGQGDGQGGPLAGQPTSHHDLPRVLTPDDLMAGAVVSGRVVLYDDDHYSMGGVLAEKLALAGCQVTLITPAPLVSHWSQYTMEQGRILRRLVDRGVEVLTHQALHALQPGGVTLESTVNGARGERPCEAVVLVTDRVASDGLYQDLKPALAAGRLATLRVIGDAEAPHLIAEAVFAGYRAALEFDAPLSDATPYRCERVPILD